LNNRSLHQAETQMNDGQDHETKKTNHIDHFFKDFIEGKKCIKDLRVIVY
jgi:hypothetical protein